MRLLDKPNYETASVHFNRCKISVSEKHNQRLMPVPDAREDLRDNNRQWIDMTIAECIALDKALWNTTRTRKPRKNEKADPTIYEAVANIKVDTTIEQMQRFGSMMEGLCGLRLFQIYLHKDEGHYDVIDGSWQGNYHAHLIFATISRQHAINNEGINRYATKVHMSYNQLFKAQDYISECTGMVRGPSKSRQHLDVIRLKTTRGIENNLRLEKEIQKKTAILESLSKISADMASSCSSILYNILCSPLMKGLPEARVIRTELSDAGTDIKRTLPLIEKTLSLAESTLLKKQAILKDSKTESASDIISRIGGSLGLSPSLKELEKMNSALEDKISSYESCLDSVCKENESLKNKLHTLSEDIGTFRDKVQSSNQILSEIKDKIESIPSESRHIIIECGLEDILEQIPSKQKDQEMDNPISIGLKR